MASVSVLFFASLRDEVGESEVELNVENLDDLRMQLTDRFGVSKSRLSLRIMFE